MESIRTARLLLRPITVGDEAALHGLYADPDLMRYITGRARSREESRARVEKDVRNHAEFGFGLLLALDAQTDEVVGRCGADPVRSEGGGVDAELAWMVARARWGRGYGLEMARAVAAHAARLEGVTRVFARAHPDNAGSLRIMERIGMVRVEERDGEIEYALPDGWAPPGPPGGEAHTSEE